MFDLEGFISACRSAASERDPLLAVRELLLEALSDRAAIAEALPTGRAEMLPLYSGPDVAVVKVVWAPGMSFPPHDHRTWACNGIYLGSEHNRLYEAVDAELVPTGSFDLDEGDVGMLDADAIHSVVNPHSTRVSAAIHVYGGGFFELPRTNWIGDPPRPTPASVEYTRALFEQSNRPG